MRKLLRKLVYYKKIKTIKSVLNLLELDYINYFDIGSVDPILNRLEGAERIINYYGFDINKDNKKLKGFKSFNKINNLLYSHNTTVEFYHNHYSHTSSIYKPSLEFINRYKKFSDSFKLKNKASYKALSLDSLKIDGINILKLDTQGSELDILKGCKKLLNNTVAIEVEIEFDQIYENQPLFDDVFKFLTKSGFELVDFTHLSRITNEIDKHNHNHGRLISADAIFFKKPNQISDEKMLEAYILTCTLYGKLTMAISLLRDNKKFNSLLDSIQNIKNKDLNLNKIINHFLKIINLITLSNNKFYKMPNY